MMVFKTCLSADTWYVRVKKDKGIDYILTWKPKVVFYSKLKRIFTGWLYSIKAPGYKLRIKFEEDPLAAE